MKQTHCHLACTKRTQLTWPKLSLLGVAALLLIAQTAPMPAATPTSSSVFAFITAGGWIGVVIILLSFVGLGLVFDAFVKIRQDDLLPESLSKQAVNLARQGQFTELKNTCKADNSMLGQILSHAIEEGELGLDAVREHIEHEGNRQLTRLHQRVGLIGLIASIAPMLGLLGTVVGMIDSFQVLGLSKGVAGPDQLAVGISKALVTTCMGLIVAVPLIFFHAYFRDKVTRISNETSAICERVLRVIAVVLTRQQQMLQQQQKKV
jgi:biopolymer transport protein ExbB